MHMPPSGKKLYEAIIPVYYQRTKYQFSGSINFGVMKGSQKIKCGAADPQTSPSGQILHVTLVRINTYHHTKFQRSISILVSEIEGGPKI